MRPLLIPPGGQGFRTASPPARSQSTENVELRRLVANRNSLEPTATPLPGPTCRWASRRVRGDVQWAPAKSGSSRLCCDGSGLRWLGLRRFGRAHELIAERHADHNRLRPHTRPGALTPAELAGQSNNTDQKAMSGTPVGRQMQMPIRRSQHLRIANTDLYRLAEGATFAISRFEAADSGIGSLLRCAMEFQALPFEAT